MTGDEKFKTARDTRKFIEERRADGKKIKPGTQEAKEADEIVEYAAVKAAMNIIKASGKRGPETVFDMLVELQNNMPGLNVRTSTSVAQQAYSTPIPLAYVASRRAGISETVGVYEPSAGNGALLIEANPKLTLANEINPSRAANLEASGFTVTKIDATQGGVGPKAKQVVIANPPFGVIKDENGKTETWKITDKYTTTQIDHAIALKALKGMTDGGRAVLIVGAPKEIGNPKGYRGKQKRAFYHHLYNTYNVVDHFTVSGDLYAKQGAAWPVDVIVIDGRGASGLETPMGKAPRVVSTIEELKENLNERDLLESVPGDRIDGGENQADERVDADGRVSGQAEGQAAPASGGRGRQGSGDGGTRSGSGAVRDSTGAPERSAGEEAGVTSEAPGSDGPAVSESRGDDNVAGARVAGSKEPLPGDGEPDGVGGGASDHAQLGLDEAIDTLSVDELHNLIDEIAKESRPKKFKDVAKRAADYGVDGAADGIIGLIELFGAKDTDKLGMGLNFDEETYKKALPFFRSSWQNFKELGKTLSEYVEFMLSLSK